MSDKKLSNLIKQLFQYFGVACCAATVNIIGFWLLNDKLGVHYTVATVLSAFAGSLLNFLVGRITVFRQNARTGKGMVLDFFGVLSTSSIGFGLDLLFMWLMIDIIAGIFALEYAIWKLSFNGEMIAKLISTGLVFIWNFTAQKFVVYRKMKNKNIPEESKMSLYYFVNKNGDAAVTATVPAGAPSTGTEELAGRKTVLVTGGAGFFGGLLKEELAKTFDVVSIDIEVDETTTKCVTNIVQDIRDVAGMSALFGKYNFSAVFHCAAILAHAVKDKDMLWTSNVNGTENVVKLCMEFGVKKLIFTSSNCLWAENFHRPVLEIDTPNPVEIYGKSKLEGENILLRYANSVNSVIFRCPTIMDAGRLGLLGMLFEFIDEGRKVWVVGGGDNRYQFVYARDIIDACIKALDYDKTEIFNIGTDDVKSFREVYSYVIERAGTKARVARLPRRLTILGMKICYALRISPLGPYQYKMIAEDFEFDTSKIKRELGWKPTKTNEEILWRAYEYFHENKNEIKNRKNVSAHKQSAKMGIIRFLKWLS